MSKKNGNGAKKEKPEGAARAPRAPRAPMGTLAERLLDKSEKVFAYATSVAEITAKRGAPVDVVVAAKDFVAQVETWREKFFGLKAAGWMPTKSAGKADIVEGRAISILPEQLETYSYITGLIEGTASLVAGTVLPGAKGKPSRVLVKSVEGQVYGFVPTTHLVKGVVQ